MPIDQAALSQAALSQAAASQASGSGLIAPRQRRSRSTHDRIVEAGRELVRTGRFDQAGFRQIIDMAGISVGAFYGRFRNKEALFQFVLDRFFDETLQWAAKTVAGIEARSKCLDDVIEGAVRTMIALYRRDLGLMRAIYLRTRVRDDPELLEKVVAFNLQCYAHLERMMLAHAGEIDHSDPRGAVRFAGNVLAAFLREAVFFQNGPTAKTMFGRDSNIEQEAAELLRRYLRGKD